MDASDAAEPWSAPYDNLLDEIPPTSDAGATLFAMVLNLLAAHSLPNQSCCCIRRTQGTNAPVMG
jgi:hypothetical protein